MKWFRMLLLVTLIPTLSSFHPSVSDNISGELPPGDPYFVESVQPTGTGAEAGGLASQEEEIQGNSGFQPTDPKNEIFRFLASRTENVTLLVLNKSNRQILVNVFDMSGSRIFHLDQEAPEGIFQLSISKKFLANGVYFIEAGAGVNNFQCKFFHCS
jgi:hypothetical protein